MVRTADLQYELLNCLPTLVYQGPMHVSVLAYYRQVHNDDVEGTATMCGDVLWAVTLDYNTCDAEEEGEATDDVDSIHRNTMDAMEVDEKRADVMEVDEKSADVMVGDEKSADVMVGDEKSADVTDVDEKRTDNDEVQESEDHTNDALLIRVLVKLEDHGGP